MIDNNRCCPVPSPEEPGLGLGLVISECSKETWSIVSAPAGTMDHATDRILLWVPNELTTTGFHLVSRWTSVLNAERHGVSAQDPLAAAER